MAFAVIYDACVLYPAPLRDLLIRIGIAGIVRARWTETILDECFRAILEQRPDLTERKLARTRDLMRSAIPKAPPVTLDELLGTLKLCGLEQAVAKLEELEGGRGTLDPGR